MSSQESNQDPASSDLPHDTTANVQATPIQGVTVVHTANDCFIQTNALQPPSTATTRSEHNAWAEFVWQWVRAQGAKRTSRLRNLTVDLGSLPRKPSSNMPVEVPHDGLLRQLAREFVIFFKRTETLLQFLLRVDYDIAQDRDLSPALAQLDDDEIALVVLPVSSRAAATNALSEWTKRQLKQLEVVKDEGKVPLDKIAELRRFVIFVRSFLDRFVHIAMRGQLSKLDPFGGEGRILDNVEAEGYGTD